MFREAGCVGDGADRESGGFVQHVKRAFVARGDSRKDNTRLTLESCASNSSRCIRDNSQRHTFGAAVNEGLKALRVVGVHEIDEGSVDPSPRFHRVKSTDDEVELQVIVIVLVLYLAKVSGMGQINLAGKGYL